MRSQKLPVHRPTQIVKSTLYLQQQLDDATATQQTSNTATTATATEEATATEPQLATSTARETLATTATSELQQQPQHTTRQKPFSSSPIHGIVIDSKHVFP